MGPFRSKRTRHNSEEPRRIDDHLFSKSSLCLLTTSPATSAAVGNVCKWRARRY